MKNQKLAIGTSERAKSHTQVTPRFRKNSQSATLRYASNGSVVDGINN